MKTITIEIKKDLTTVVLTDNEPTKEPQISMKKALQDHFDPAEVASKLMGISVPKQNSLWDLIKDYDVLIDKGKIFVILEELLEAHSIYQLSIAGHKIAKVKSIELSEYDDWGLTFHLEFFVGYGIETDVLFSIDKEEYYKAFIYEKKG